MTSLPPGIARDEFEPPAEYRLLRDLAADERPDLQPMPGREFDLLRVGAHRRNPDQRRQRERGRQDERDRRDRGGTGNPFPPEIERHGGGDAENKGDARRVADEKKDHGDRRHGQQQSDNA